MELSFFIDVLDFLIEFVRITMYGLYLFKLTSSFVNPIISLKEHPVLKTKPHIKFSIEFLVEINSLILFNSSFRKFTSEIFFF